MRNQGKRVSGSVFFSSKGKHLEEDSGACLSKACRKRLLKKLTAFSLAGVMMVSLMCGSLPNRAFALDGAIAITANNDDGVIDEPNKDEVKEADDVEVSPSDEQDTVTDIPDENEAPKTDNDPSVTDKDEQDDPSPSPSDEVTPPPAESTDPEPSESTEPSPAPSESVDPTPAPSESVDSSPAPSESVEPSPAPSESVDPSPAPSEGAGDKLDGELVPGDELMADGALMDNGILAASTAYTLTIPHATIGDCSGANDTLTFELSGSGIETTTTTVTGNKEVRFTVNLPTAGTYNLSARCTSGDTDSYYADTRTCKVTLTVASNGSVTEGTKSFVNASGPVGVSSFITTYPMQSSVWSDATVAQAQEIMAGMSTDEKIGQCFLVHYPGDGSGSIAQARTRINKYHPGGYLVFAAMFNNSNPTTVQGKTSAAQADALADSGIPMLFTVDEEGGKVVRISDKAAFGHAKFDFPQNIAAKGEAAVEADAADKAQFLKNLGLNVNHAPVGDVSGSSGYIYPRTYGGDGLYNGKFVAAAVRGHEENGIATTVKHFPGYGGTGANTHNGFAINDLSLDELRYNDLIPFYQAMGAGGKSFMVTHNIFTCLDSEMPASLSPAVIAYARDVMRFDGVIMTDDLNMKAVINAVGECHGALASLKAGVDMPMTPLLNTSTGAEGNDVPLVQEAVASGELSMARIEESCLRVLCWKIEMGLIDGKEDPDPPTPPIPEEKEAEWTSLDGKTTEQGTFDDMWAKAIASGGTVKMLVDIDTTGDKSIPAKNITLNLNGHKLHFTNGTNGFIVNGSTSTSFTITDNVDPIITTEENPTNKEEAAYNAVRRTLVYYTMSETGVETKYEVDMDACGGISGANTGIMVEVKSGVFNLEGGVLSHKVRAVETVNNANNVINIKGGAIVGCGVAQGGSTVNGSGVGVYGGGTVNISGGYIGGNSATTRGGGIYVDSGKLNMSGGVLAANRINTNGGAAYINAGNTVNITGGTIASNYAGAQGGAFYILGTNTTMTVSDKAFLTMNSTDGHGGAIFSMAGWGSSGNATINVEGGLFTGNSAQNGGAIRSGSSESNGGTINVTGGKFCYNQATALGGALHVYGATKGTTVKNATFTANSADNGGAMCLDTGSSPALDGLTMSENSASSNGGAIYSTVPMTMGNMTIKKNTANQQGGGMYLTKPVQVATDSKISVWQNTSETLNADNAHQNNMYLSNGAYLTLQGVLNGESMIGVTTQTTPTDSLPVRVATASKALYVSSSSGRFRSDVPGYSVKTMDTNGNLVPGAGDHSDTYVPVNGVMFQYYATVRTPSGSGDSTRTVPLVDTSGGIMPQNGVAPTQRFLYLNEDGSVKLDEFKMAIYKAEDWAYDNLIDLNQVNKFQGEEEYYQVTQLWTAPNGDYGLSLNADDWTVYPWTEGLDITTDPETADATHIYVPQGSVVRFVAEPVDGLQETAAIFYDYDITDGNLYATIADAWNGTNPLSMAEQATREAEGKTSYYRVHKQGINSEENYLINPTGTAKFAFGNGYMYNGWDNANAKVFQQMTYKGVKYPINTANRGTNNFKLCSFGIPLQQDENGHIVYKDDIAAPYLFDEGTAIGKTTIAGHNLEFTRQGDSYILQAVSGTTLSDLTKFGHPRTYTHIWTNDFWPLDDMGTFGAEGHDPVFGKANDTLKKQRQIATSATASMSMSESDDGLDHNSYFGMQFAIEFDMEKGYCGPMEYYFFGDDDMWVFLDGKLVSDVGGVHPSAGSYVDLWDYIPENDSGHHKLSFYFTERGASGSTCWMRFNLPHLKDVTQEVVNIPGSLKIAKTVEGIETDEQFEFTVTLDLTNAEGETQTGEFSYIGSKTGTLKSGDTFTLANGEYIIVQNLPAGTQYKVTETPNKYFTPTSTGDEGTIGDNQAIASFVNTARAKVGTLRISKSVVQNKASETRYYSGKLVFDNSAVSTTPFPDTEVRLWQVATLDTKGLPVVNDAFINESGGTTSTVTYTYIEDTEGEDPPV